jgi:hypothetical protein
MKKPRIEQRQKGLEWIKENGSTLWRLSVESKGQKKKKKKNQDLILN